MPTKDEVQALADNTTIEWTTTNGVYGRLVRGKGAYSSASIFLPAAGMGYLRHLNFNGSRDDRSGSDGYGWSSTSVSDSRDHDMNFDFAWSLSFDSDYFGRGSYDRLAGYPVRPVREVAE